MDQSFKIAKVEAEQEHQLKQTNLVRRALPFTSWPEAQLWQEFRTGNQQAFDYIFEKYIRLLYSYGHKLTAKATLVEDCIQDLFVELWEKKHLLSSTNSIKYYLFKSLRRKLIRALEKERHVLGQVAFQEDYPFDITFSHEAQLISNQITEAQYQGLTEALTTLSKRQKEVIYLRYFSNLSYEEVAAIMGLNLNSTYKIVSKAIHTLKQHLRLPVALLLLFLG